MSALEKSPTNPNHIYQNLYRFVLQRLPLTAFFGSSVNLPGISLGKIRMDNIVNPIHVGGTKLEFEEFSLTFKVDEDLKNYQEIWNWMAGIATPEDLKSFQDLIESNKIGERSKYNIFSDATLTTLTNAHNTNVEITFKDMFPIALSGLDFEYTSNSPEILTARVTFAYDTYSFRVT